MRHDRTINNNILFCSLHSRFMHHVLAVHNIIHNRFFVVIHIGIIITIIPSYAPCRPCSYRSSILCILYFITIPITAAQTSCYTLIIPIRIIYIVLAVLVLTC